MFFEFHPVAGGGALIFSGGDAAGQLEGSAVEEEFFGEGGFSRIGMGDDGEGAAAGDLRHGGKAGEWILGKALATLQKAVLLQ